MREFALLGFIFMLVIGVAAVVINLPIWVPEIFKVITIIVMLVFAGIVALKSV